MPDCKEQPLLAAYHDDELTGADRATVEAHLKICPTCAAELAALRATSDPLRELRRINLSDSAVDRIHEGFAEATDDTRFMRIGMSLGVIAASVMLIGFAWLRSMPVPTGGGAPAGPIAVSPLTMEPWERTAITLRPEPSTLPLAEEDRRNEVAAQWMLDNLKTRGER